MPAGVQVSHKHMPAVILHLTFTVTIPHQVCGYDVTQVSVQVSDLLLEEGIHSLAEQTHVAEQAHV